MGKNKDHHQYHQYQYQNQKHKEREKVEAVLHLLAKQYPLSLTQEKFCNTACVERFLKAKGDSVKKAAKQLRNCLAWRHSLATDNLIADEFSAELADGVAYVAGHDDEARPVVIFRIKQDYHKFHSQKLLTRLLVFTLEVAVQTMAKNVEQFVVLFDGSFIRSASAFLNIIVCTLKMISDYYPGRLHKSFLIDPPSLFSCLWKGVKPFVDLSQLTTVVSSLDFEESMEFPDDFASYPRAASLRFDPTSAGKIGSCSSSRFSFTVSHHFDSLKPWYLSFTDMSASKVGPTSHSGPGLGPARISPLNARSLSFASPSARGPQRKGGFFFPSTPLPQKTQKIDYSSIKHPRTPNPSFLHSPGLFFKKECHAGRSDKCRRESFLPFLRFYRRPYDEMTYRSKMRPPLGGLISIVSPHLKRPHLSMSQRF